MELLDVIHCSGGGGQADLQKGAAPRRLAPRRVLSWQKDFNQFYRTCSDYDHIPSSNGQRSFCPLHDYQHS